MTVFRMAYDDGAVRITRASTPGVLAIAGDIDEYSHTGLAKTLSRLTAGHREIHISLGEVEFCDLAGLRAIILLTWPSSADRGPEGARLVLHEIPPRLNKILQILGWDTTPGLVIQEPDQHCPPDCHAASTTAVRNSGRVPWLGDGRLAQKLPDWGASASPGTSATARMYRSGRVTRAVARVPGGPFAIAGPPPGRDRSPAHGARRAGAPRLGSTATWVMAAGPTPERPCVGAGSGGYMGEG